MKIQYPDIKTDLEDIVSIHIKSFPNFFLTLMGNDFLKEYYKSVLEYQYHICLTAKDNKRIIGFVTGFGKPQDFYDYYRSKRKILIPKILLSLIKNPLLLHRVLQNFRKVSNIKGSDSEAELSSICVLPEYTGTGAGKKLLHSFIDNAKRQGFQSIYLTTDKHSNDRVNTFYLKQGFHLEKSFSHGKREMNFFRLMLTDMVQQHHETEHRQRNAQSPET